jgi:ketosteroid isomerase-like protein
MSAERPSPEAETAAQNPVEAVRRFNAALNAHDVDAMMALMTEDCVFENTLPPPDGARYAGQAAVRAFWDGLFRDTRAPRIEIEEIFGHGERVVMRWAFHWLEADGRPGHVRGVDVYRLRAGRIAEKLSYVKG